MEHDRTLRNFLLELLNKYHYIVFSAADADSALNYINKTNPDLILLDQELPELSSTIVLLEVKRKHPQTSVILLTKPQQDNTDTQISKPIKTEDLLTLIKRRLRDKAATGDPARLKFGDLTLDKENFQIKRGKKTIPLTPKEFQLLEYLMSNPNRVLTRDMILSRVWIYSPQIETRVVDIYISFLRHKIDQGHEKKHILSVRGFGYKLI